MDYDGANSDVDWENRVLCSDESCIGVIGRDGCCKECGKRFEGDLPESRSVSNDEPSSRPDPVSDPEDTSRVPASDTDTDSGEITDPSDEWDQRTLCRDEACIGVIGRDGCCKECGRPFES